MTMTRRTLLIAGSATLLAAPTLHAGGHGRLFSFRGINNHTATGTAEIAGRDLNLLGDFVFDGAPDPKMALGNDGVYDPSTLMGQLENYTGTSSFTIPDGIDPDAYNEVWIWCERFNVGLAIAAES